MKTYLLIPGLISVLATPALADHQCAVLAEIQIYDATTFKLKEVVNGTTDFFNVTSEPHEDAKSLDITSKGEKLGTVSVWTGTVLSSTDGDVIQANASFEVKCVLGTAALAFSLDTAFAKTTITLKKTDGNEFLLMPVDIKCVQIK